MHYYRSWIWVAWGLVCAVFVPLLVGTTFVKRYNEFFTMLSTLDRIDVF